MSVSACIDNVVVTPSTSEGLACAAADAPMHCTLVLLVLLGVHQAAVAFNATVYDARPSCAQKNGDAARFWAGDASVTWAHDHTPLADLRRKAWLEYSSAKDDPSAFCGIQPDELEGDPEFERRLELAMFPRQCRLQVLSPMEIVHHLAGMRLVFIGDSLMRQQAKSFRALLHPLMARYEQIEYEKTRHVDFFVASYGHKDRFELIYPRQLLDGFRTLELVDEYARNDTIILINQGAHGLRKDTVGLMQGAAALWRKRGGLLIWVETSPTHFPTPDNAYHGKHKGPKAIECQPIHDLDVAYKASPNRITTPAAEKAGIPILYIFNATAPRWDDHHGGTDCRHFCFPGPVDFWAQLVINRALYWKRTDEKKS